VIVAYLAFIHKIKEPKQLVRRNPAISRIFWSAATTELPTLSSRLITGTRFVN
jgi:hypothetical protein